MIIETLLRRKGRQAARSVAAREDIAAAASCAVLSFELWGRFRHERQRPLAEALNCEPVVEIALVTPVVT